MIDNFFLVWVSVHALVLGFGFAIGLVSGLKIPILGDVIATFLVGRLLIFTQNYLLINQFEISGNWILYSLIGLIVGVGGGFLFIFLTSRVLGLKNSHILSLPITLSVLTIFQVFQIQNLIISLYVWPIISMAALIFGFIVLYIINRRYDLALELLANREPDFSKIKVWAFTGLILGLFYGVFTGFVLI